MSATDGSWRERLQQLLRGYDQSLRLGHDAEVQRELQDQEDLILRMLCGEAMGLPNPASYYALELYPVLIERYHEWHRRMGMAHSPLDHIRCC